MSYLRLIRKSRLKYNEAERREINVAVQAKANVAQMLARPH